MIKKTLGIAYSMFILPFTDCKSFSIADKPEWVETKQAELEAKKAERAIEREAKKVEREGERELRKTEHAARKAEREIERETEKLRRGSEKRVA